MIPYGRQHITQEDINAVIRTLNSDFLTQGPQIDIFEELIAKYCGCKYAVAVSSATAALHLACLVTNLHSEDEVWTSPNSFVASANCALYTGAKVKFVDIDSVTYNMSIDTLIKQLEFSRHSKSLPKVLIPVHFSGQSCDMKEIYELKKKYDFKIIEDASHAIGGLYQGKPIGSCEYSDMTVFSFHPVKIITTGEGGMITTNNEEYYKKLIQLRTHGITRDPKNMTTETEGPWYYQQIELGFNYRITDIQAALGISQLKRIDEYVLKRNTLAERYHEKLNKLPLVLPTVLSDRLSSYHLYVVQLSDEAKISRGHCFNELRNANIGVNVHYIPIHLQPYYQNLGFKVGDYPVSEAYYTNAISLPLYPGLTLDAQDYIINTLYNLLK